MKKMLVAFSAVLIGMGWAGGVSDTSLDAPDKPKEGAPTPEFQSLVRSYNVLGQVVKGSDNEDLGRITQILLHPESGQAIYVIITSGGGLGVAQDDRLVPWQALQVNPQTYNVTMDMTERQFEQAPKWAVISSERQAEEINRYYGTAPRWQQKEAAPAGQQQQERGTEKTNGNRAQEPARP